MPRPLALTPAQRLRAAELYAEGHSRRQIAAVFSVSDMAVRTALKRQRVAMRDASQAQRSPKNPARFQHSRPASVWELGRVLNRRPALPSSQQEAAQ
jgi:transposase